MINCLGIYQMTKIFFPLIPRKRESSAFRQDNNEFCSDNFHSYYNTFWSFDLKNSHCIPLSTLLAFLYWLSINYSIICLPICILPPPDRSTLIAACNLERTIFATLITPWKYPHAAQWKIYVFCFFLFFFQSRAFAKKNPWCWIWSHIRTPPGTTLASWLGGLLCTCQLKHPFLTTCIQVDLFQ